MNHVRHNILAYYPFTHRLLADQPSSDDGVDGVYKRPKRVKSVLFRSSDV